MLVNPRDLADRVAGARLPEGPPPETFTLPIDAARRKVRDVLDQTPQAGYTAVVENWRQTSDGQIEFTVRHLRAAD